MCVGNRGSYRSIWQFNLRRSANAIAVITALAAGAPAYAETPGWSVDQNTEALTGASTIVAVLDADAPVSNMLGQPERPSLIMRCKEMKLVVYVVWPQVLNVEYSGYSGSKALVQWRLDDQPIATDLWSISSDGTATGMFESKDAAKLLRQLSKAKRFALRLTGSTTEDAAFSLQDVAGVSMQVSTPVGFQASVAV